MAESMFQPIIDLLTTPLGLLITIIFIIGFIIYWYSQRKEEEDIFEIETYEDVLAKDIDEKFKLKGLATKSALTQGFDYLGNVSSWMREQGVHQPLKFDQETKQLVPDDTEPPRKYDIYLFKIGASKLSTILFGGESKYVVVDKKHIANLDTKRDRKIWNLKPGIQIVRWGGVFITSEAGEEYLTDIGIKRSHENTLTYLINYSRKIIYLEMKHSKAMDKYAKIKEIDTEYWRKYKKAEGVDEEGEESD